MDILMMTVLFSQMLFSAIAAIYFFTMLKSQAGSKVSFESESKKQMKNLDRMKRLSLTIPLSEKTRPASIDDIIGQKKGLKALKAALCCPNPQHVIIYGPPGVGKTAAARVVLNEAVKNPLSPFKDKSKYIEIDATTLRFDDRGMADPLMGSVHDPIYQGAGAYGSAGIPHPKAGAVTKAHGGILFIDEIGELHPVQMNKLLKVLEDRKVYFESAYYNPEDKNIPEYIHEIFKNGLPADFRLVAATTRSPDDIPPAIRSRCVEIFFSGLGNPELVKIAERAALKGGFTPEHGAAEAAACYAQNGRDCVNIIQMAGSIALQENRKNISVHDVEWVAEFEKYSPKIPNTITPGAEVGCVNGLAVYGACEGMVFDIEAVAKPCSNGKGTITITGIVETERYDGKGQKLTKKSSAAASVENMATVLRMYFGIDIKDFHIHINMPGGTPVDGPSAGISIICSVYSAITGIPIDTDIAMTGELSVKGAVKPVGGVVAKAEAAKRAGVKKVFIPKENYCSLLDNIGIEIVPVSSISDLFHRLFHVTTERKNSFLLNASENGIRSAESV